MHPRPPRSISSSSMLDYRYNAPCSLFGHAQVSVRTARRAKPTTFKVRFTGTAKGIPDEIFEAQDLVKSDEDSLKLKKVSDAW